jgi:NADH-quinone oxidoreductase subunit L
MSLNYFGTLEFDKLFNAVSYLFVSKLDFATIDFKFFTASVVTVICIFLIIAAVGKSAQFGLHTWLPDAMEGPTPVSALIHAATMVTAGVYLVVRTSFFFEYSEVGRNLILILGAFTAMFGSIVASYQFDIK